MRTKTLLASMAVASLAAAQPLSAATRSFESLPESGVRSADRVGSISGESDAEEIAGNPLLVVVIVFVVVGALILALSGNKSPG
jgi:hypothetical protein